LRRGRKMAAGFGEGEALEAAVSPFPVF